MHKHKVFHLISALAFTAFAILNTAIAQSMITTQTPATAKIKHGGVVLPTVYESVPAAAEAATDISQKCYVSKACNAQVAVLPADITIKTAAASSATSSRASSQQSSYPLVAMQIKPIAVTASTTYGSNVPANSIDGDPQTRYESQWMTDPTWIRFDLGANYQLGNIQIDWEDSNADTFAIEGSTNGSTWVTLVTKSDAPFGARTDNLDISGNYRYLRIYATKRPAVSQWGYSIYEVRITTAGSSSSSQASTSSQSAAIPLDATKISFTQSNQRVDGSALPLSEIKHNVIVKGKPGEVGQRAIIAKQNTLSVVAPLPWPVYQGESVFVYTVDNDDVQSGPSEDATK